MSVAEPDPLRGIALKIISVVAFTSMSALVKAAGRVPAGEIVFFRSFFAIFPIAAYLAWTGTLVSSFRTHDFFGHIWRGSVGVLAMGSFFFAITRLHLPEATALGYASPMFVVILSALLLGEQVRIYRWSAVVIGLVGVLIVSWPSFADFADLANSDAAAGAGATLFGALMAAFAMIFVRRLVRTETTQTIVLYFSLSSTVAALLTLPFGWIMPDQQAFVLLMLAGVAGGVGQLLLTESYRYAEASVLAPFEYTSMLIAIAVGYVVFDEVPTAYTLAGGTVIVGAGIFIIWRERQLGLRRGPVRAVATPSG